MAVFHDKKAFDALVVKYQAAVRRFFLSQTLGDAQLSDDLAQVEHPSVVPETSNPCIALHDLSIPDSRKSHRFRRFLSP